VLRLTDWTLHYHENPGVSTAYFSSRATISTCAE
jgi:hypothetical protein